uniref:Centromere protein S n=1 Tax=Astatotilapia calliptera TaxID=8154 RepID=A0AAX7TEZ5_ASTCA
SSVCDFPFCCGCLGNLRFGLSTVLLENVSGYRGNSPVGRLCQKIGEDHRRPFSRQAIAAIAETTFRQCDIFAKDLEAFARHAKRSTVSVDDVKLVARRSTALSIHIQNKSDELTQEHMSLKKKTTAKRKNTETEEESRE